MTDEIQPYLTHQWVQYSEGLLSIGLTEDALEEFSNVSELRLPQEGESIEAEMIFGEAETDEGPLDLYCPVNGVIAEVNSVLLECPESIFDDPTESWLIKVEPDDADDLDSVDLNTSDD